MLLLLKSYFASNQYCYIGLLFKSVLKTAKSPPGYTPNGKGQKKVYNKILGMHGIGVNVKCVKSTLRPEAI